MLDGIKSAIRQRLWAALGPPASAPAGEPAPLGVDRKANLPLHYEPPECPICVQAEFECHDCGKSIIDPEAPFGIGMESITYTHLHVHGQRGRDGAGRVVRIPARRKLCLACFRIDWAKAHPGKPCDL